MKNSKDFRIVWTIARKGKIESVIIKGEVYPFPPVFENKSDLEEWLSDNLGLLNNTLTEIVELRLFGSKKE